MAGVPLRVVAEDQLKTDIFYRFNQSIQAFFNEAAGVPTEFGTGYARSPRRVPMMHRVSGRHV